MPDVRYIFDIFLGPADIDNIVDLYLFEPIAENGEVVSLLKHCLHHLVVAFNQVGIEVRLKVNIWGKS